MQVLLFVVGAVLGYWSARRFASATLALALNAVPLAGLTLALVFC